MAEKSAAVTIQETTTTTASFKTGTPSLLQASTSSSVCSASGSNNKLDIKVSSDGVAKLNFSFLDELQGGDSSLEPGEVVTPPHSASPVAGSSSKVSLSIKAPSKLADVRASSQTEAQVCEEKVRAILELDAKKRKEELEKRKLDLEIRRQSGELEREEEQRRKEKAERKRIKRIEKEQRAARLSLLSDDNDEQRMSGDAITSFRKCSRSSEDRESGERVSSSEEEEGKNDSSNVEGERIKRSAVNSVAVLANSTSMYHSPLPAGHLPPFPDAYGNAGFRPMNIFSRNIRPDFHHTRGGYMPRCRGGRIGNNMRFPLYRTPFYGGNTIGGVQSRTHGASHAQRTQGPSRGHSPTQTLPADLRWTKAQPPLSYSLKWSSENKLSSKTRKHNDAASSNPALSNPCEETENTSKTGKDLDKSRKKLKKEKKLKSKEKQKHTSRSRNSEKSSLRQIAKIRKTFENRSISKNEVKKEQQMPVSVAISDNTPRTEELDDLKDKTVVSGELTKKSIEFDATNKIDGNVKKSSQEVCEKKSAKSFDIFAESPTHNFTPSKIENDCKDKENAQSTSRSCTPPIELLHLPVAKSSAVVQSVEKTPLQRAIEMQQRIGKLLQDDDLQAETLEATKEKLLQKTHKLAHKKSVAPAIVNVSNSEEQKNRYDTKGTEDRCSNETSEKTNGTTSKYLNPFRRSSSHGKDNKRRRSHSGHESPNSANKFRKRSDSKSKGSQAETLNRFQSESRERIRGTSHTRSKSRQRDRSSRRRDDFHSQSRETKRKGSKSPSRDTTTTSRKSRTNSSSREKISKVDSKDSSRGYQNVDSRSKNCSSSELNKTSSKTSQKTKSTLHNEKNLKANRPKKLMPTKHTPLSFNASEFLFPDADENSDEIENPSKKNIDSNQYSSSAQKSTPVLQDHFDDDDTTASSSLPNPKFSNTSNKRNSSPDTDDYMDNWELDDPDSSNTAAESNSMKTTAPSTSETSDKVADLLIARFKNPSPQQYPEAPSTPIHTQSQSHTINVNTNIMKTSSTPPLPPQHSLGLSNSDKDAGVSLFSFQTETASNEQFAMQDIYDEFIKSVEATGVDITPLSKVEEQPKESTKATTKEVKKRSGKRNLSTSSSSSSSSSSSYSSSSSSSGSSATKASSASSSLSPADEHKIGNKIIKEEPISVEIEYKEKLNNTQTVAAEGENSISQTVTDCGPSAPMTQTAITTTLDTGPTPKMVHKFNNLQFISSTDPVEVFESVLPDQPAELLKGQIEKDLKRVKAYEANLKRIQMMRSNFDSTDDIFGELAKMEKLFLHAIKFIIQKYTNGREVSLEGDDEDFAKPKFVLSLNEKQGSQMRAEHKVSNNANGQFVQSLRETPQTEKAIVTNTAVADVQQVQPPAPEEPASTSEVVNIFDSNRETIKMTIAPLKLTKTSAIFDKLDKLTNDATRSRSSSVATGDDADFTETLVKPTKEVAIVKPMSKDIRTPSPRRMNSRRQSPRTAHAHTPRNSSGGRNSRSGSIYRNSEYRSRRSSSRSRHGIQRRGRPKTLSVSPQRRESNSRHDSPKRRGKNTSPVGRYRSGERRSRSPNRRPQSKRDISPFNRRRRIPGVSNSDSRSSRNCDARSYSRSYSRSRSPAMHHHRFGGRGHSPRGPPSSVHRRSYSRDKYSRSPLPFKPPSPPMRHSPDQDGSSRHSLSRASTRSRRSRSYSRSPSTPRKGPRSPLSSGSRSPRSPRSPHSPRPHTPPANYDHHHDREDSYEMYRTHSPSQHHSYFSMQHGMGSVETLDTQTPASSADYYYDASSMDVMLNGPETGQRNQPIYNSYEANYHQYTNDASGGYLAHEMQPGQLTDMGGVVTTEYYENHFIPTASVSNPIPNAMTQAMYSAGMSVPNMLHQHPSLHPPTRPHNYYFNNQVSSHLQQSQQRQVHQSASSSLLKELPKATIAVQKGNVLEIVPSELAPLPAIIAPIDKVVVKTEPDLNPIPTKPTKTKKPIDPVKEEINKRLQESAKLRETRKTDGEIAIKTSILKKANSENVTPEADASAASNIVIKEEPGLTPTKKKRKKVLFEDGLFPNRDSDDEDSKDAEKLLRQEVRRMRKMGRKAATVLYLLSTRKSLLKQKPTMSDLAKLPPPPPPPLQPLPHLEQPVSNRPLTPPRFVFYHYDAVVHALYTSHSEQGIPPRLTDPKAAAAFAASKSVGAMIRPRCSPSFTIKRDTYSNTMNALKLVGSNHNGRGSPSPQLSQSPFYAPRRSVSTGFFKQHQAQPYLQQPHNASHQHHQRFSNHETLISTLSTQPLAQPKTLNKPIVATFQTIKPYSPQLSASIPPLAASIGSQHLAQQTPPVSFPNNIDIRALPPQHPAVFSLPPHPGSMTHPLRLHPPRLYSPNMSQTAILVNGAVSPASNTATQVRHQPSQPQSYAYQPYVPQSPIRPTASQKNALLTTQPRGTQQFNVFP